MSFDESKDLMTMKGTIDVKEMVSYLNPNDVVFTFFKTKFYL